MELSETTYGRLSWQEAQEAMECGLKSSSGERSGARHRNSTVPSSALAPCSSIRSIVQRDC